MSNYKTTKKGSSLDEQLRQLMTATWDGDLISKEDTNQLSKIGMVKRKHGFNFITESGVEYLLTNKFIAP